MDAADGMADDCGYDSPSESESEASEEQQADEVDDVRALAERLCRKVSVCSKKSQDILGHAFDGEGEKDDGGVEASGSDGIPAASASPTVGGDEVEGQMHDEMCTRAEGLLRRVSAHYRKIEPDATASSSGRGEGDAEGAGVDGVPMLDEPEEQTDLADEESPAEEIAEEVKDVEQKEQPEGAPTEEAERRITNRNEKKARKMMTRLGMRPVPSIARVTLKPGGGRGYFFIDRPDVFVGAGGNGKTKTYVIFGQAMQGGQGGFGGGGGGDAGRAAQAQAAAAQQRAAAAANAGGNEGMPSVAEDEDEEVPELADADEAAVDEGGVEAKDIDLVMGQASCSRAKAVAALKENDGDLVNAIMSLTT